jgi:hypothetical protein
MLDLYIGNAKIAVTDTPYYYFTEPFGSLSEAPSRPTSGLRIRKRYDFKQCQAENDVFLARAMQWLPHDMVEMVRQRSQDFATLAELRSAQQNLSDDNYAEALHRAISCRRLSSYLLYRLLRIPGHAALLRRRRRWRTGQCVPVEA